MKKAIILFILSLLILNIFIISISAETPIPELPGTSGEINQETGLPEEIDNIKNIGEDLTYEQEAREYWAKELKIVLLKNKYISAVDSFFTKISIVFQIFFGEPYTFSSILLVIVILWFYFFFKFSEILSDYSTFSPGISWVMGFAITIVMAQIQILRKISEFILWLTFYKETGWLRFLIFIILFAVFTAIYVISSKLGDKHKSDKLKQDLSDIKEGAKTGRAINKSISDKN